MPGNYLKSAVVTLGAAVIAAGYKSWARLRRLSTQLHGNSGRWSRTWR